MFNSNALVVVFDGDKRKIEEQLKPLIPNTDVVDFDKVKDMRGYDAVVFYGISENHNAILPDLCSIIGLNTPLLYCPDQVDFDFLGELDALFNLSGVCLWNDFEAIANFTSTLLSETARSKSLERFGSS